MSYFKAITQDVRADALNTSVDSSKTSGTLTFDAPFNTGLYIAAANGIIATIIYE